MLCDKSQEQTQFLHFMVLKNALVVGQIAAVLSTRNVLLFWVENVLVRTSITKRFAVYRPSKMLHSMHFEFGGNCFCARLNKPLFSVVALTTYMSLTAGL
jgi:hypothetical protein